MKKTWVFTVLILILLAVTACGNSEGKSVDQSRQLLLKEAELYIKLMEMGETEEAKSSSEFIRNLADGEDKKQFLELADLMDQEDVEKVRALHAKLGGEYIEPKTTSNVLTEANDKFAALSIEAAQIYVESVGPVSLENRTDIADLIKSNYLLLSEEQQNDFEELAKFIENDNKDKAIELHQKLKDKYGL
ncbi:hypothetical protein SAMN05661091_4115 [Paenibacillus uliginis N3/975]|uniref:Lipoprotein n=1 Tax=Paenibacillus uliginis N3/975 TaxID=1313296 RepID=A0A1X7HLN5_9BACL|nr:hypothetical protein [Paenibacillus uliginis]SMF88101.1 hypothetical protein SAMN05661091_4115 [Paenibacillus uliginis N3/975]